MLSVTSNFIFPNNQIKKCVWESTIITFALFQNKIKKLGATLANDTK